MGSVDSQLDAWKCLHSCRRLSLSDYFAHTMGEMRNFFVFVGARPPTQHESVSPLHWGWCETIQSDFWFFFFSVLSDLLGFFLCWRPLKASETAQIGGQPGYLVDFLIVPWFKGFYKPPMTSDWNIFILFAVFSVLKDTESRKKASYDCKSVIKATERFLKPMKSLKWT